MAEPRQEAEGSESPGSPAGIHKRKNGPLRATDPGGRDPSRLESKRLHHRELAALFTEHRDLMTSRSITLCVIIRNFFSWASRKH